MAEPIRWLALGYSVPVNPSKTACTSGASSRSTARNILNRVCYPAVQPAKLYQAQTFAGKRFWRWGRGFHRRDEVFGPQGRAGDGEPLSQTGARGAFSAQGGLRTGARAAAPRRTGIHRGPERAGQADDSAIFQARSRNHFGLSTAQDVEKGLYAIISVARQASAELSGQLVKAMDKAIK